MVMRNYPDDRERNPVQLTLREFINEALEYYNAIAEGDNMERLRFLKFILAGRRGVDLGDQRSITLNVTQGQPDIHRLTGTRDFDSLIGTTKTLPYIVPLTIWPAPSFRDTLTANNHVTAIALDNQNNPLNVPMHKIPNLALGKVANRSVIRVFFPRMYHRFDSNTIPAPDIELIYNRCLRPLVRRLMPNQVTHWPVNYQVALETSRDAAGRFHFGSLDIAAHLLPEFATSYLQTLETLQPYFRDAYFGHELRGWKAATVHNIANQHPPAQEEELRYERVRGLEDLTRILDMPSINLDQWLVDVGLEFGIQGKIITWRTPGHHSLLRYLLPDLPIENVDRIIGRSKTFYVDNQMHLKDLAGFRWTPGPNIDTYSYIQAYTTEKAVSYQLHDSIFRFRKPSELLSKRKCDKLIDDLDKQSDILFTCTGEDPDHPETAPQEGCARLEVRVPLANANDVLVDFPRRLINETMIQIPASHWWFFKWLRLAGVFLTLENLNKCSSQDRISENSLALGAVAVWLLNGAHRTPMYRTLNIAKEACAEILVDEDEDPEDPDALTMPLMYEAGTYFICDIVADNRTGAYRVAWAKQFTPQFIAQAYEQGTIDEIHRLLGSGNVQTGRPSVNSERTSNRTAHQTMDVQILRPRDRPLPQIGNRLDGLPMPVPRRPQGPDVDHFNRHGGGNRRLDIPNDPDPVEDTPANALKEKIQLILEQMYYDILQESPNKKSRAEGAWTNIPLAFREQLGVEDLYMRLKFPFHAVQYTVATDRQWDKHFNRFFPDTIPQHAGQNFGKARYYLSYISLIRNLSPQRLQLVRAELRQKFNRLAWIPHTESDRMWCTKKTNGQRWKYLPANGRIEGPKIAINPISIVRLGHQPSLQPSPRIEDLREEEEEGEGEEGEGEERLQA